VIVMRRVANALAWTPTVIAVGVLGPPEEVRTAQWMVAHLGTIDGTTVLEARTTLAFLVPVQAILQARRGWTGIVLIGLALVMRVVTGTLVQMALGNLMAVAMARSGGVAR